MQQILFDLLIVVQLLLAGKTNFHATSVAKILDAKAQLNIHALSPSKLFIPPKADSEHFHCK
jgi:hypothetical protein